MPPSLRPVLLRTALLSFAACDDSAVPGTMLDDAGAAQDASGSALDAAVQAEGGQPPADAEVVDAPSSADAGSAPDAGPPGSAACVVSPNSARCNARSIAMIGKSGDVRRVYWAEPTSAAPASGRPVVILFQGSYIGPATTWDTDMAIGAPFGGYYQVALIAKLLESGYVVIQPEAGGGLFWSTNTGGDYTTSADGVFMPLLLGALEQQTFGKLDLTQLYATGISSGGYMTSRMAVSYAGRFRALAIQSGSYATCLGPLCNVPAQLPSDHPPTLLLHGGADLTVGIATARDYEQKLKSNGLTVKMVEDPAAGHQWLRVAPDEVTAWFQAH